MIAKWSDAKFFQAVITLDSYDFSLQQKYIILVSDRRLTVTQFLFPTHLIFFYDGLFLPLLKKKNREKQ